MARNTEKTTESSLGWLMSRAGHNWRTVVDRHMADLGLTQTRWVAMLGLHRVGEGCSQAVLAAQVGVEQPSLVRTLGQLEVAGLIERRANPADARSRTVWFTPAGKSLLDQMEEIAREGRELLLQGIDAKQRRVLHDLLLVIIENAQAAMEVKPQ